ncbi:ead/Ea22-like family protein [Escherichia coli]|nr:ead/Ea22-like family protein [Escherichia coli]
MSNIDKQALRQLAVDAKELAIIKRYTKGIEAQKKFIAAMTPALVLALLDELEATYSRIGELEVIATDCGMKFQRAQDALKHQALIHKSQLESAEKRIAELEARTLVPVEPTLDQLVAGKRRLTSSGRMSRLMSQRLAEVYRAMVNAAAAGKGDAS